MQISLLNNNLSSNYFQFQTDSYKRKFQNNKANINFGAGWNIQVEEKIKNCNIGKKQRKLKEKFGIEVDFKGNKTIAWCCYKVSKIFNRLNQDYHLKLPLPKAIYVEDFSKLNLRTSNAYGFCNAYPALLFKDSDEIFSERTLFFNSFDHKLSTLPPNRQALFKWENIDSITEQEYSKKKTSSNHFLNIVIHEFCHSAHIGHLFEIFKVKDSEGYVIEENLEKLREKLEKQASEEYSTKYKEKFSNLLPDSESYESENPFETIAYDMSKKIDQTLDETRFYPKQNPFKYNFYPNKHLLSSFILLFNNNIIEKFLRKVWNGKDLF